METAYLLLGSNLGDRKANFSMATKRLASLGQVVAASALYETKPWGQTNQPDFLNQCIALNTHLTPQELLLGILDIEQLMGRVRVEHWGPRLIDIDILLFGNKIIEEKNLLVPHPQLANRMFALVPLAEIAGKLLHPQTGKSIQQHLADCPDTLLVQPFLG